MASCDATFFRRHRYRFPSSSLARRHLHGSTRVEAHRGACASVPALSCLHGAASMEAPAKRRLRGKACAASLRGGACTEPFVRRRLHASALAKVAAPRCLHGAACTEAPAWKPLRGATQVRPWRMRPRVPPKCLLVLLWAWSEPLPSLSKPRPDPFWVYFEPPPGVFWPVGLSWASAKLLPSLFWTSDGPPSPGPPLASPRPVLNLCQASDQPLPRGLSWARGVAHGATRLQCLTSALPVPYSVPYPVPYLRLYGGSYFDALKI